MGSENEKGWRLNVDDIIAYENGDMEWERLVCFFQNLINEGLAWSLQGHYGRMASSLIEEGYCHHPEDNK